VSDLHVDYWKDTFFQYDWKLNKKADYVIIAGDVADDIGSVVHELRKACDVYKKVIYIDGNHESSQHYNDLSYANRTIKRLMSDRPNFVHLYYDDFIVDNLVIIGACAWWDFKMGQEEDSSEDAIESFNTDWNPRKDLDKDSIVSNIVNEANLNHNTIKNKINRYKHRYNICVVTHTVPCKEMLSTTYPSNTRSLGCYGNSAFQEFIEADNAAVKYFVFGHNHDAKLVTQLNHQTFINNARGRPCDFNREHYTPLTVELV
jgi:Icc-related predicted phosphoesterase